MPFLRFSIFTYKFAFINAIHIDILTTLTDLKIGTTWFFPLSWKHEKINQDGFIYY